MYMKVNRQKESKALEVSRVVTVCVGLLLEGTLCCAGHVLSSDLGGDYTKHSYVKSGRIAHFKIWALYLHTMSTCVLSHILC